MNLNFLQKLTKEIDYIYEELKNYNNKLIACEEADEEADEDKIHLTEMSIELEAYYSALKWTRDTYLECIQNDEDNED